MSAPLPVTLDVNVFISALSWGHCAFTSWPSPPPTTSNPSADCVGILSDGREFSLMLSEHVLVNVVWVLTDTDAFGWPLDRAEQYVEALVDIAQSTSGAIVEPGTTVTDCADHEDNRILELALASGSVLIVSNDTDLLSMSPWRGIPIVSPKEFAGRVDAMRRARRR